MALGLAKKRNLNGVLLSFIIAFITACVIFLPFIIIDKGFFTYCGDFNSQQIPFNIYLQNFVKTQKGTWSWATDLGSSVINSYSFYNIGSPFFWLSTLFPNSWVPYLMVPNLILKFSFIAAFACLYLQRYAKTRNMAVIVSVMYAFCGFNVYNIFFNHMLEPVLIFPLMLWALDEFVYENRRGVFALTVGFALLNNYFFFIGNAVFILIYFVVKLCYNEYKISLKDFMLLALEVIIGVGIGMVLALPSFFCLIQNPRVDNFSTGFSLVMYGKVQQYFAIFASAFFPPDTPYSPNLFTEGAIKWTSMSAYLPFISMAGVIAYMKSRKKDALKTTIIICIVMAFVPFLNSAFYAFNSSYYARWYYMALLMFCLATLRSLEDKKTNLEKGAIICMVVVAVFAIFGILPNMEDEEFTIGLAKYQSQFWVTIVIAFLSSLVFYIIVTLNRENKKFSRQLLAGVLCVTVIYSVLHMSLAKLPQWERDEEYKNYMYDTLKNMEMPENDGFYRIDTYEMPFDNVGLWMNQSCLHSFNSVVTPAIMEFYPSVGVKRDVSSKPEHDKYYLRNLLNTKYVLVSEEKVSDFLLEAGYESWVLFKKEGPISVYENPNFIPLGFTYDFYMTSENYEEVEKDARERVLLECIILNDEQAAEYGHLFAGEQEQLYSHRSYEDLVEVSSLRRQNAAYETSFDSTGFSAKILLDENQLVFFSVPYDDGFTAFVNGTETEVLKVSGGLMAVEAKAGDNEIIFSYETKGFKEGKFISLISLACLGFYVAVIILQRKKLFIFKAIIT